MRPVAMLVVLAFQLGAAPGPDLASDPNFQPYQRAVLRTAGTGGQACVVLDAATLGHTASRGNNDLRLYAKTGAGQEQEAPYVFAESSAEPGDVETVAISNERVQGSHVEFDLHMPGRAYSEIDLLTGLKDFVAVAQVTGSETQGGHGRALGTLTLFDFSSEGLPASTQLPLAETNFSWVHVRLHFMSTQRGAFHGSLSSPVFTGAQVPPSRQAQVLYTAVAETHTFHQERGDLAATLDVSAHVPVERVRFELAPQFRSDFLQHAEIKAHPAILTASSSWETFEGEVGRVNRPDPGPGVPPVHYNQLTVPVAVGANLHFGAYIRLTLSGAATGNVPWSAAYLEMRRRSLCFETLPDVEYTLRYGDASLGAPVYAYAKGFALRADAIAASLGPEEHNPGFRERGSKAGWRTRSPELFWVALIAVVSLVGVVIMERLRRHGPQR